MLLLAAGLAAPGLALARGPCPPEPIHTYFFSFSTATRSTTTAVSSGAGWVGVTDTNTLDCNGDFVGNDFDGDYDLGFGGTFFGYGAWAMDVECDYDLNTYGPYVVVNDIPFGPNIHFVTGEDDQAGPVKVQDPNSGEWTCLTDGSITPCPNNDPSLCDPLGDADDCLSGAYVGFGESCGTGGGDGGFWVFLLSDYREEGGFVNLANPPSWGTITNTDIVYDGEDTSPPEDGRSRTESFRVS